MEVLTEKESELTLFPVKHHSDNDGQIVTSHSQSRVLSVTSLPGERLSVDGVEATLG